ncbi:MAG: hypothetical protein PF439_07325 [Helicobacteraceae bacterium]|jgi:hypothetical protein|nr:hypothetical protein [Helicobacteraceae bacterium]
MEINSVPQDNSTIYNGQKRALYATSQDGEYGVVASSGWDVEEEATMQAVVELERLAEEAYEACVDGVISPLEFHMYSKRLDLLSLSQATGLFQWRIKRHFKPAVFAKLSDKILARYADVMGVTIEMLKQLPKRES